MRRKPSIAHPEKTTVSFAALDAEHLDALVEEENRRNPSLNLRHFNNQLAFVGALRHNQPASFRAIFPRPTQIPTGQSNIM
ncbi:YopJ family acetyltransferase [Pseudomonas corrugata]